MPDKMNLFFFQPAVTAPAESKGPDSVPDKTLCSDSSRVASKDTPPLVMRRSTCLSDD